MREFIPQAVIIPLTFTPRFQIGTEVRFFNLVWIRWRDVTRRKFYDEMIERGLLSANSDIEATTILHGAGAITRDGRTLFRVLKH